MGGQAIGRRLSREAATALYVAVFEMGRATVDVAAAITEARPTGVLVDPRRGAGYDEPAEPLAVWYGERGVHARAAPFSAGGTFGDVFDKVRGSLVRGDELEPVKSRS